MQTRDIYKEHTTSSATKVKNRAAPKAGIMHEPEDSLAVSTENSIVKDIPANHSLGISLDACESLYKYIKYTSLLPFTMPPPSFTSSHNQVHQLCVSGKRLQSALLDKEKLLINELVHTSCNVPPSFAKHNKGQSKRNDFLVNWDDLIRKNEMEIIDKKNDGGLYMCI